MENNKSEHQDAASSKTPGVMSGANGTWGANAHNQASEMRPIYHDVFFSCGC